MNVSWLWVIFSSAFGLVVSASSGNGSTGLVSISKRSDDYSISYEKWNALAVKRTRTIDALKLIDSEIYSTLQNLQTSTDEARFAITKTTKLSNVRSFTYGITTILASFFLIEFALDGVDRTSLTVGQQLNVAGNLGFAYGYGGPYILDGQLTNGDPGCGVDELRATLGPIQNMLNKYNSLYEADGSVSATILLEGMEDPIIARTMVKELVDTTRTSVFCLISQSGDEANKLSSLLGRLETALNTRMDLVTSVINILDEENEHATLLGYDTNIWPHSLDSRSTLW